MFAEYPELSILPLKINVEYERLSHPIQVPLQITGSYTGFLSLAKGDHHVITTVVSNEIIQKMFPWQSLAVQWAYMGERTDYKGDSVPAALLGETWLLACYHDSFGEYPPWNQKG